MTNHLTRRIYGIERLALWACVALSVMSIALYLYFLSSSVASIVLRQEMAMQIRSLGAEVSALEANYLQKKQTIRPDTASSFGFVAVGDAEKIFLTRKNPTATLSLNAR